MTYYFSYDAKVAALEEKNFSNKINEIIYTKDERHCTMLYSKGEYDEVFGNIVLPNINVLIKDVVIWENKEANYLVALLEDKVLTDFHEKLKLEINIDETLIQLSFKPHVTLQKTAPNISTLSPKMFDFLKNQTVNLHNFRCINKGLVKSPKLK